MFKMFIKICINNTYNNKINFFLLVKKKVN